MFFRHCFCARLGCAENLHRHLLESFRCFWAFVIFVFHNANHMPPLFLHILLYSTMTTPPPSPIYTPKDSQSAIDKESRIQSNVDDVMRRQEAINRWNRWYIGFLTVTFI